MDASAGEDGEWRDDEMFIRSERLFLRPAWPEDAGEIAQLRAAGPVMSNMHALALPDGDDAADLLIATSRERPLPGFLITLPSASGTHIIGAIGLGRDGHDIEMGYWLTAAQWGKGYAAEAARAVLSLARALGHHRVVANQFLEDRASLLVLTRAGFRPTGRQRVLPTPDGGTATAAVYVADLGGDRRGGNGPKPGDRSEQRAA
jgi:RimJ/RimL family protein N-acetyltransferase